MNGIEYSSPTQPMTPIMTTMAQAGGSPWRSRPASGRVSGTNFGFALTAAGVAVLLSLTSGPMAGA